MRIGVIGAGKIGATATRLFVAGHDVAIANSRGPQTLAGELGERARVAAVTSGLQVTAREAQAVLA